jgi:hypothetical protein
MIGEEKSCHEEVTRSGAEKTVREVREQRWETRRTQAEGEKFDGNDEYDIDERHWKKRSYEFDRWKSHVICLSI